MKLVVWITGVIGVLGLLALGLFIARGPQPEIVVPAEVIYSIGWFNITNTMIAAWSAMIVIIALAYFGTRSLKLIPGGIQNFLEAVIGFLVTQIEDIAGEKNGRRFFTLIATIFLFILVANWMGLLPFFNAIGKTEDIGHEIFHEISAGHPEHLHLGEDGTYTESHEFTGWILEGSSSFLTVRPNGKAAEFEVAAGQTPGEALDSYIVFLAKHFGDIEATDEEVLHPSPELVEASAAELEGNPIAPKLLFAEEAHEGEEGAGEGGEEVHPLESPTLGVAISGVSFEDSKKLALIIPYFRSTFSDVNNTLAMGIVAFVMIEFYGIQTLGLSYLSKFFNLKGIMSFVGFLELLSELIRIISFGFRLFGNIFAGEVLILMLTFLMPFLLVDIIYGLELFVGFIQAAVFALLTLVFAVMAIESHDDEHGEHHDEGGSDSHDPSPTPGAAQAH